MLEVLFNIYCEVLLGYLDLFYLECVMYGGFYVDYFSVDVKIGK